MREFEVAEDSVEVGIRVEVALRGTLVGRVEFGEVAATELLYVHAVNRLSLSGAVPAWLSLFTGIVPFGSVQGEFEFHLAPGEYVVQAFGRGTASDGIVATARTVVRIEPGEASRVDLRMGPAAHIRFQCGLVPGLVTELWMAKENEEFALTDRYVGGGIASFHQDVAPGTYRWRVRFLADEVVHDAKEAATALDGTVTVAAGETVILPGRAGANAR